MSKNTLINIKNNNYARTDSLRPISNGVNSKEEKIIVAL